MIDKKEKMFQLLDEKQSSTSVGMIHFDDDQLFLQSNSVDILLLEHSTL